MSHAFMLYMIDNLRESDIHATCKGRVEFG